MGFGTEKCSILIIKSGKRETTEGIELPIRKTLERLKKKRKLQVLGNFRRRHHQITKDEKMRKEYLERTRNLLENKQSHKMAKQLGSPLWKIFRISLNMSMGRVHKNGSGY